MRLRTRLVVTAIAVTLPSTLALFLYDAVSRHRAAEQLLSGLAQAHMNLSRRACEDSPETWSTRLTGPAPHDHGRPGPPGPPHGPLGPRHGPPPPLLGAPPHEPPGPEGGAPPAQLFAYDEQLTAHNPRAPALSDALKAAIAGRQQAVSPMAWASREVLVLVRTPWASGPCAYVLAQGTTDGGWGSVLPRSWLWLLPSAVVFAAVLGAVGPVVRRIRRLTTAVRASASSAYISPVELGGDDELSELARAFDASASEIRQRLDDNARREQALRDFLSNTTHDVMIPLTVLQGHLTTLREQAARGDHVELDVILAAMSEAHYTTSLLHNLGVVAKLDGADEALQRTEVDLSALVARVAARHRPIAQGRGISLESATPREPLLVRADQTLLEQAVSNVVFNAVRYNDPGGHVALSLDEAGEASFCLRVVDDGPGISAQDLARITQRGERGDSARSRAPEGQGIGLSIALRAAKLLGLSLTLGPSAYGGLEAKFEGPRLSGARPGSS